MTIKKLLTSALLLSASQLTSAQTLNLFIWNDYISEQAVKDFEAHCQCKVAQNYYSSTEEMMAKLQAGASGYDVVVPTQNAVEALIKQKALSKLDKAALPNLKNIDTGFINRDYDPGNRYSVPYAYTTTLLGYNEQRLQEAGILDKVDDWAIIFDPEILQKIKGKVTVLNESEEVFAAALKYLGYSVNDRNKEHLQQAKDVIIKAKPYWAAFNSSSYIKELSVGNIWLAHGYSSDMMQARNDAKAAQRDFSIGFALPKQGAVLALDNMVIPASANNKSLAQQFVNFMLDGKNAASLTNKIGAGTPNASAYALIKPEFKAMTAIFPDADTLTKLETLQATSARERRLINRYWTELKVR